MQQCPTCGSMNPADADVCADCGMELPKTGATPTPEASAPTPAPEVTAPVSESSPPALDPIPAGAMAPTPFDFAPDAAPSIDPLATPDAASSPSAPDATDPFGGDDKWDFNLDKGAQTPPAEGAPAIEPAPAPSIEPAPTPESSSAPTQVVEPSVPPPATSGAAPAGTSGSARLILKRGGAPTGDVFAIGASATVGRFDPESGPVDVDMANLPESVYISRHHAEVNFKDGQWMVKDLGSRNGTFVKNAAGFTRVTGETAVVSGDEVAFGNARFEFQTG